MTKKEATKKLEELYYECFSRDLWRIDRHSQLELTERSFEDFDYDYIFDDIEELEIVVFGSEQYASQLKSKPAFKKALKKWNELKSSPLYEALK